MTTLNADNTDDNCPAQALLKTLSGKWKPQLFKLATIAPLRFNNLLRQLEGSNKQSLSAALKELADAGLLSKHTLQTKPLHIEYSLTKKGKLMIPIFEELEGLI
ncbi:winged helix-turn-helix transcriptional regulator [Mucilaginibacter aquatilis]|uniref:Transcriptional regulator n=1 Tax=Mucilaginibacter aquatilis TaxID=1517760 RepID=A0A6I4IQC2_9SPHI|nr:helix-turn-helix domain-containing protein [Mucilaginibacter aquatilis]MVN90904.1 transcriptional regulator [Mucilaginibacter aquatilis]